jgi:hypothetical protein
MMARPKKKQKILASHWYLDLTQELEKYPSQTKAVKESFDKLVKFAENIHPGAISVIESIQDALSSAAEVGTVQYVQASKLSLQQVIKLLGIKFVLGDPDYRWSLKDHQVHSSKVHSKWAGTYVLIIPTNSQRNLLIFSRNFHSEDSTIEVLSKIPGRILSQNPF